MTELVRSWMVDTPTLDMIVRLAVAAALGGLIGIERETHGRSAGFRTQMLVALGAALAMVVSLHFADMYGDVSSTRSLRIDPARMAYGVMGGIGFLGAGAIIHYGVGVRGLTTAASLWCTAAVGLACGFGMYDVALATTAMVVFALVVLVKVNFLIPPNIYKAVKIKLPISEADNIERCSAAVKACGAKILSVSYRRDQTAATETVSIHIRLSGRANLKGVMGLAAKLPELLSIEIN